MCMNSDRSQEFRQGSHKYDQLACFIRSITVASFINSKETEPSVGTFLSLFDTWAGMPGLEAQPQLDCHQVLLHVFFWSWLPHSMTVLG